MGYLAFIVREFVCFHLRVWGFLPKVRVSVFQVNYMSDPSTKFFLEGRMNDTQVVERWFWSHDDAMEHVRSISRGRPAYRRELGGWCALPEVAIVGATQSWDWERMDGYFCSVDFERVTGPFEMRFSRDPAREHLSELTGTYAWVYPMQETCDLA